jgi:cobalt-zinc-cadmium efflux system outer membrane protein
MKNKIKISCLFLFLCFRFHSQETEVNRLLIDYKTFIELVWKNNLGYASERLNINIAEAEIKASKVFNDPELSIEYADNDDKRMQMGRSISIGLRKTFGIGKRTANIDLAKSKKELTAALLENYFQRLRAKATLTYLETMKQTQLYEIKKNSCNNIERLAKADSIRFSLGKISDSDALQSQLEAEIAFNNLCQSQTELLNAYAALGVWTGDFDKGAIYIPSGRLKLIESYFDLEQLLQTALSNRADLTAALKTVEVVKKDLEVVKRARNPDIDLSLGFNHNTEVRNEIAPAPLFNGIMLGIAIPLKFSDFNKGAVHAAELRRKQSELNYQQAELEVKNVVTQNLRQYYSLLSQAKRYETHLIAPARSLLEGKIYSYERGETSRLEVLVAQNTFDELQSAYITTLSDCLAALVELETSAGIWDIDIK